MRRYPRPKRRTGEGLSSAIDIIIEEINREEIVVSLVVK